VGLPILAAWMPVLFESVKKMRNRRLKNEAAVNV
jgi:hypothetical protein